MTNPAILEALAKAMNGPHLPVPIDGKHTLSELRNVKWQNIGKGGRQNFLNQAAAVVEMVGPKPLHWMNNGNHWAGGLGWVVRKMGGQYVLTKASRFDQYFDTLEAAQSAAQAHADAAHWANTKIGGE